ncbi:MAG: dihydrofolate synthase/folylpolyglutamate synthase [Planctomycetota bacterium]|jgi:dihydrofolate synthase/folylpolyglutamate synthase
MRFATLEQWLDWQMVLHDKTIDLGLDRVRQVADRLGIKKIGGKVITVAGTNGKGSTVASYENWLHRAGFTVASYTSPHLLKYNERIKLNTDPVRDQVLCQAFAAIDDVRDDIALTFFEFGTLAGLYLMQQWEPDFAILEVGLGGRLDAVNIIDADLIHLTPIGIDHQSWLGDDREKIGFEKAGVLRAGRNVIVCDSDPPDSVLKEIERLNCEPLFYTKDFQACDINENDFCWKSALRTIKVPRVLPGEHQIQNLSGVVAGLTRILPLPQYSQQQIEDNFIGTTLPGRFQQIETRLPCRVIIDVGHNRDAAKSLSENIAKLRDKGRVVVLLGMLEDKQADWFAEALQSVVDIWWCLTLEGDRGLSADDLRSRIESKVEVQRVFKNIESVIEPALSSLTNRDIMLVTGSFVTAELALRAFSIAGDQ